MMNSKELYEDYLKCKEAYENHAFNEHVKDILERCETVKVLSESYYKKDKSERRRYSGFVLHKNHIELKFGGLNYERLPIKFFYDPDVAFKEAEDLISAGEAIQRRLKDALNCW